MIKLRDYQIELISKIENSFLENNRIIAQLPTGAGKTTVFSELTKRWSSNGSKVLLMAHRSELIDQIYDRLTCFDVFPGVIQASHKVTNYSLPVQVASLQTLVNRELPHADYIIIDECHHFSEGSMYDRVLSQYPNAKILGVTATPTRLDGKGFDGYFNDLITVISTRELIEKGYLSDFEIFSRPIDLKGIKLSMGDYSESQLAEKMGSSEVMGDLVSAWVKHAYNQKTIVFAVNVEHSKSIVKRYVEYGVKAAHIDGNTPKAIRDEAINRFKNGDLTILSNCDIATEGLDVPDAVCLQDAKPTKSLVKNLQKVGRVLRTAPGKQKAIILDHANGFDTHGSPDFPFIWTLQGVEKPVKASSSEKLEEELNEELKEKTTVTELKHIELVKRDRTLYTDEYIKKFVKRLEYALKQGWKPLGAYRFWLKNDFPEGYRPSTKQLDMIAKYSRFKSGWVFFERNNLIQGGRTKKIDESLEVVAA